MNKPTPALRRLQRVTQRVRDAESRLAERRDDQQAAIVAARKAGASIADIGRALEVSRQRAQRIIRELEG